jgi:hypothetical protein
MQQSLMTIVASVNDFDGLRPKLTDNPWPIPFSKLPSLHFSSMTVAEDEQDPLGSSGKTTLMDLSTHIFDW